MAKETQGNKIELEPRICAGPIEDLVDPSIVECLGFANIQVGDKLELSYFGGTVSLYWKPKQSVQVPEVNSRHMLLHFRLQEEGFYLARASLATRDKYAFNDQLTGDLYREKRK